MSEIVALIFPLNNFDSDMELLRLDDRTDLRRTNSKEIKKLRESAASYRATIGFVLQNVSYVLETRITYDELSPDLTAEWPYLRDIVLALRLLHTGDVSVLCSFWLHENKIIGVGLPPSMDLFFSENSYFLKKEETTGFDGLWKKLQKSKESKPYLDFPLTQFTKAFEERASGGPSDAIVDYMVAFESLIFHGMDKSIEPAGEVMGIAISMLLGINQEDRTKIKTTLKNAYEVRNAKVHGNVAKLKKLKAKSNVRLLSMNVEDYLRFALRRFIEE